MQTNANNPFFFQNGIPLMTSQIIAGKFIDRISGKIVGKKSGTRVGTNYFLSGPKVYKSKSQNKNLLNRDQANTQWSWSNYLFQAKFTVFLLFCLHRAIFLLSIQGNGYYFKENNSLTRQYLPPFSMMQFLKESKENMFEV